MNRSRYLGLGALLGLALLLSNGISVSLPWLRQLDLAFGAVPPTEFSDFSYLYGHLPRLGMALIVGALLGLAGSLMQQLTQNTLTSPLTLGTSSGAWLALIILNVWFSPFVNDYSALAAMSGAMLAFLLVLAIVGLDNISGLPVVIAGMVVNILLGAIATGIILLNEQFAQNVFMWGAGDLAQNGWDKLSWLAPNTLIALLLVWLAPRALTLLRIGQDGARSRGLAVTPIFLGLMALGIWLVSASITSVGVIGFIGLICPNIARAMGARTPRHELLSSALLGALLLLVTDRIAVLATQFSSEVIPSGITAALIGAPALIWFSRRQLRAQDALSLSLPAGVSSIRRMTLAALGALLVGAVSCHLLIDLSQSGAIWHWPSLFQWHVRWPRLLSAVASGAGLAVAGVLLQRLIYNPLASPDILGVSAGATFALIVTALISGQALVTDNWLLAMAGSGAVLGLLILMGRRHQFSPSSLILTGIALTALLEASIQFCLARGSVDSYRILIWLSGSTYRVSAEQSVGLAIAVALLISLALISVRWLALLSIGRAFAMARGVNIPFASLMFLGLVALLCAVTTATLGPLAFVGLVAPHLAAMLGARKSREHILLAASIGATLMLWADWLGQALVYPAQIAAGTLVSIIGGLYFITLLLVARIRR